jgi:hypothetical protein
MKYYLKSTTGIESVDSKSEWIEVTKEEFIQAERSAGFWPKGCTPEEAKDTTATGGFSGNGISGRVDYEKGIDY